MRTPREQNYDIYIAYCPLKVEFFVSTESELCKLYAAAALCYRKPDINQGNKLPVKGLNFSRISSFHPSAETAHERSDPSQVISHWQCILRVSPPGVSFYLLIQGQVQCKKKKIILKKWHGDQGDKLIFTQEMNASSCSVFLSSIFQTIRQENQTCFIVLL